jgi:hypothetical protein
MRKTAMSFEEGKTYEFTLSDGQTLTLRFQGFGAYMRQIWLEPATGATTHQLPPYKSYREV